MEKGVGCLYLALVHFPVCNKNGETIGSAVTNLDVHDIARACRTFGVTKYYLVTPFEDQRKIVAEIVQHWREGYGAQYNGKRKEALQLVEVVEDLNALYQLLRDRHGDNMKILATGAAQGKGTLCYSEVRRRLCAGENFLLLFGTGWGLGKEVLREIDGCLPAICGPGEYNHLSVRCAAAIILDRLCGTAQRVEVD